MSNNNEINSYIFAGSLLLCFQEGVPAEGDEFVDFRTRVSELVRDVVFIVGSSTCFTQVIVWTVYIMFYVIPQNR